MIARDARDADVLIYDRISHFDRPSHGSVPKRLLLYAERNPQDAAIALRYGFDGAIARDASPHELSAALFAVAAGHLVVSPTALSAFSTATNANQQRELSQPLTEREIEVLRLIGNGKSNKAVGEALRISEHTAKFHVSSILSKLGVETRTDAARIGIKLGLIPL